MLQELKQLAGMREEPRGTGYFILRFWHPDSGRGPTNVSKPGTENSQDFVHLCFKTEEEAQEYCADPKSSCREGDTSEWYFDGYISGKSRTGHLTLWGAAAAAGKKQTMKG